MMMSGSNSAIRVVLLVLAASGCDPIRTFDVAVTELPEGVQKITWDGGNVHDVEVKECAGDCECDKRGYLDNKSTTQVWAVGYDLESEEAVFGDIASSEPLLESPLLYGQEDIPGDERHLEAKPLEPGKTYGVEATLYVPCDPPTATCMLEEARGCTTFTVGG